VAVCASARQTRSACEAGVETHPAFRRRGHAARVVRHWAKLVIESGATPLYSTSWRNQASSRLAIALGFEDYGVDFHLT
jgi:predicted GNAT family acetyltransferase